jgi:alanine racemase
MTDLAHRPTYAEIDLNSLRFNLRSCREFIGTDVNYMAVVKANAYGHGAVECSTALVSGGVDWLGVAIIEEAIELRLAGIEIPILCLGGFFPGQEDALLEYDVTPVVFNIEQAILLNAAAETGQVTARFHLKIDTGMGRLGIRWDHLSDFMEPLNQLKNIHLEGLMSHFAAANDPNEDVFTNEQIDRLLQAESKLRAAGFAPEIVDIANSPGAVGHPRARSQMVRLGGVLYGLSRDILNNESSKPELRPVLSLHSAIADIKNIPKRETVGYGRTFTTDRDSKIALVPIGYNDGYRRSLSNKANVLISGQFAPVVGRISMDWTILDVTDRPNVKLGDRVTLIGRQGDKRILTEDLAQIADTISYEITCGISSRVRRRVID